MRSQEHPQPALPNCQRPSALEVGKWHDGELLSPLCYINNKPVYDHTSDDQVEHMRSAQVDASSNNEQQFTTAHCNATEAETTAEDINVPKSIEESVIPLDPGTSTRSVA